LFLKDTQLKKAQITPSCPIDSSEVIFKGKLKNSNDIVASNEGYRRVRHSAAMIGLALSMGATGILLPNGDKQALAADPSLFTSSSNQEDHLKEVSEGKNNQVAETTPSLPEYSAFKQEEIANSSSKETQKTSSEPEVISIHVPVLQHEVQEGETLWQLSQDYQVTPEAIAASNEINPQGTIKAGETLDIPTNNGIVHQTQGTETVATLSQTYGVATENIKSVQNLQLNQPLPEGEIVAISGDVDSLLKQQQESALNKLQQEKNQLRKQLAKESVNQSNATVEEIAVISPESSKVNVLESTQAQNNLDHNALEQQNTATNQTPSAIIPETALLPSGDNTNNIDFHHFTEPINIPVPLPGVQEQNNPRTQNTQISVSKPSTSLAPELPEITIPVQEPIAFAPASPQMYTVRRGDTIDSIARNYGISRSELMTENSLTNPHLIKINQQLRIPEEQRFNSNRTEQTVTLIPSNSLSSNQALPTPVNVEPVNSSTNAVVRMTDDLNRFREEAQNSNTKESDTPVAFNPSNAFNQNISIPVEPYQSVNPEWQQNRGITPSQPSVQPTQSRVNTAAQQQQPEQLIAAAPIASSNYNPAFQIPVGETVSPELPGLASPDQYLPNSPSRFEGYIWPAKGVLTSGYGWRWGRMHKGVDIAAPIGTPIVAAAPGEVVFAGWNSGGYGNLVKIKHDDGSITLYAHNNRILVRTGQYVDQGQQISEMGSTGYSTGPHLHFEVHPNGGSAVNPIAYLPRR
jgi:murein DD-endopeptidase MepM/ murein hydrolase activator NlpD